MKIILNFLPLKTGGGVQVALDFLNQVRLYGSEHQWLIVAREGSPFSNFEESKNIKIVHNVPDNVFSRLFFENFGCKTVIKKYKPDLIYTQFGPHWPSSNSINVVGCAYSNLFYPEIDFWKSYGFIKKIERNLVDFYRKKMLKKADLVIFETPDLSKRSVAQGILPSNRSTYVLPAVSSNVGVSIEHSEIKEELQKAPKGFRVCLISGYSINKNFEILLDVLVYLKEVYNRQDVFFILTLSEDSQYTNLLFKRAQLLGVLKNIINLGVIPFDACAEVYRRSDAAILPANLESFSNNIAESWAMGVPLLISDMDWARSVCGEGALYIDQKSPKDIAEKLVLLSEDPNLAESLIEKGSVELAKYPTSKERFLSYLQLMKKVVN